MVQRQSENRGVTIVDLDGTLLTCNSLSLYLRNALLYALRHGRPDRVAAMLLLYVLRRLRIISHETMKYKALACAGKSQAMLESFERKVHRHLNTQVMDFINHRRSNGDRILVATAAAQSYVGRIWDGDFIASPMGGPDCRGSRKRDAISDFINQNGLHLNYFLTDHHDDIPCALFAVENGASVVLVNPRRESLNQFNSVLPTGSFSVLSQSVDHIH